jgi:hypothetical protein
MKVQERTIEKIRNLINEETVYRSGPQLVSFFNELGFSDEYGQGFPSRWVFTDAKLNSINDSSRIEESILKLLAPINFIGKSDELDKHIAKLNEYLAYDGYLVERNNREVSIRERTLQDEDKIPVEEVSTPEANYGIIAGGSITAGGDIVVNGNKTMSSWNKTNEHWYQKPIGQIIIGLIVTVGGGTILYFLFGV